MARVSLRVGETGVAKGAWCGWDTLLPLPALSACIAHPRLGCDTLSVSLWH